MLGIKQEGRRAELRAKFGRKHGQKPRCPCCGQEPQKGHKAVRWAELFGHRCPHGEPCISFATDAPIATVRASCIHCRAQRSQSA